MEIISTDEFVRSDAILDLKEIQLTIFIESSQKRDQLTSMMPDIEEAFDLMGVDIVDLSTENDALKNKISSYDEIWLEESKAKLLTDW